MWLERDFTSDLLNLQSLVKDFIKEKEEAYIENPIPVNIYDHKDKVYVAMPVAGIPKKNIDINYENNTLTVKTKKGPAEIKSTSVLREERKFGELSRVLKINTPIDSDKIQASYKNGFLIIEMNKKEEAKPRKIKIQ